MIYIKLKGVTTTTTHNTRGRLELLLRTDIYRGTIYLDKPTEETLGIDTDHDNLTKREIYLHLWYP